MDLYADNILDHSKHPRNKRILGTGDWELMHTEHNPSCGDKIRIGLKIENDTIVELGWDGEGCAISQAGMSILSETLAGKNMKELEALSEADIKTLLGVPISTRRLKCALLCLHTLKNALHSYKGEPVQTWHVTSH